MTAHKPRKRRRIDEDEGPQEQGSKVRALTHALQPSSFPLVAFLWPAKGSVSQWITLPAILIVAGLFRWAVSFWPYSGMNVPPMHGDFEAQRHWMELTINLPMSHWYFYDLQWWGLDYPPLTAYHSWLCGKVGSLFNTSWFELFKSRGLDNEDLKLFMRSSVIVSEYLIYIPAIVIVLRRVARNERLSIWENSVALVAVLMQPATILTDHGHFQYNTVMLGFVAATISSLMKGSYLWACVYFVASLGFKQMALFYAPIVFAYLLGICVNPTIRVGRLISIALVTAISFAVLFAPLLIGALYDSYRNVEPYPHEIPPLMASLPIKLDRKSLLYPIALQSTQAIHRIFPFARGLFEDKVANIWCAIHTFHKLHQYPQPLVQKAALLATSAAILPPCLVLFLRPRKDVILPAFAATAWAFFLCSYQVHEKNVLLPLLPMTLMLGTADGLQPSTRAWVGLANMLGCWTMYPLLQRDLLRIPYFTVTLLWAYLLGLPPTSIATFRQNGGVQWYTTIVHGGIHLAMIGWHLGEGFVAPPAGKPDFWVVVNVLIGAGGFGLCYLWCVWQVLLKSRLFGLGTKAKAQ